LSIQPDVAARRQVIERFENLRNERFDGTPTVRREFNNADLPLNKILLVTQIFIGSQKDIELRFG
jgi:hypothetical protein